MAKKSQKKKTKKTKTQKTLLNQVCNPDAAGIDVGAEEIVLAVPADRDPEPVRTFGTFNEDLREAVQWLKQCSITTVAMESTGNYWVTLYQVLEENGIECFVVNARHLKSVPGRKSDVQDAQWIQRLHTAGLLRKSFVPDQEVLGMRFLHRQRQELIRGGCQAILHMQKVLTEMNVQLHHVISDIDGVSGRRIIEAIIAGQRDPVYLESLRDGRCKTPKQTVIKALDGNFRQEYVLSLQLAYQRWKQLHEQIEAIEQELSQLMAAYQKREEPKPEGRCYALQNADSDSAPSSPASLPVAGSVSARKQATKHEPCFDIRGEAARIYGTDLSLIPGVSSGLLSTLICEIGGGDAFRERFSSSQHFTSWLGLCPDNRISGSKPLGRAKTRRIKSRISDQLRMCAMTLWRSDNALGNFCRRMKAKLGKAEGISATAHKMARIIYALITTQRSYEEEVVSKVPEAVLKRRIKNLEKQAENLGYQLVAA